MTQQQLEYSEQQVWDVCMGLVVVMLLGLLIIS